MDISSFKSNEIPENFQTGIIALKWPEDTRKSPVNNRKNKSFLILVFFYLDS
jgi:hypothetical protein